MTQISLFHLKSFLKHLSQHLYMHMHHLEEFDMFCRFIDGMNMNGFVENDFMSKPIQKLIRNVIYTTWNENCAGKTASYASIFRKKQQPLIPVKITCAIDPKIPQEACLGIYGNIE